MHRLIEHQLIHEVLERSVGVHQLGVRADKVVGDMTHTTKKGILIDKVLLIHPVGQVDGEGKDLVVVARDAGDLVDDNGQAVTVVHLLEIGLRGASVSVVGVQTEVVRGAVGDKSHELLEPGAAIVSPCRTRAAQLLAATTQLQDLIMPDVCGLLWGDPITLWLVEVQY